MEKSKLGIENMLNTIQEPVRQPTKKKKVQEMPKRSRSLKSRILNQTPPSSIDIFDSKVLFND